MPSEPAVKGKEHLKIQQVSGAKVGGAICYDYDFPYLDKGFGDLDADMVALPSSDWRGIDPLHSKMAAFRAGARAFRFAFHPLWTISSHQSVWANGSLDEQL